ncbi:MAG: thioredoxin family protein [Chitinophagaceae bacterium]
MRKLLLCCLLAVVTGLLQAQDMKKFSLYKPAEDAKKELAKVIQEAKAANKHVFVQIGGNWCVWCARFHEFINADPQIDSVIKANYIVYHLNYSPENKNQDLLAQFGYPQRFGFPVFIILDKNGNRIHTQNSGLLEEGKGYSKEKVMDFFTGWTPKSLDPEQYKKY